MLLKTADQSRRLRRLARTGTWLAAVGVSAIALAACGGSSSSDSGTGTGAAASAAQQLKIAVFSLTATPDLLIAEQNGYFKEQNLTVNAVTAGTNATSLVTSGQADVGFLTFLPPVFAAAKGADTKVILAQTGGFAGGGLWGNGKSVKSLAALRTANPCRIGTNPPGTASYGFVSTYIKNLGLSNCKIVPLASFDAQVAEMRTGRIDAAATSPAVMGAAANQFKFPVLIDATSAKQLTQYAGANALAPGTGYFGLASRLQQKRAALQAFFKAWAKARQYMLNSSVEEIAATLEKTPTYQALSANVRSAAATATANTYKRWESIAPWTNGYITSDQWNQFLQQATSYGLPSFKTSNPAFAYDKRVDMSFYTDALGKPSG